MFESPGKLNRPLLRSEDDGVVVADFGPDRDRLLVRRVQLARQADVPLDVDDRGPLPIPRGLGLL
jgi:hypothetical protein